MTATIADINLKSCCNNLISAIKEIWRKHYPDSIKNIDNYELIDIQVPTQSNKYVSTVQDAYFIDIQSFIFHPPFDYWLFFM